MKEVDTELSIPYVEEIFTAKQAYTFLKISRPTFIRLCNEGRLKSCVLNKNGKKVRRIPKSECIRFARGET